MDDDLPPDLGKRVGNLAELPEALRRQLQVGRVGAFEQSIIDIIRDMYGGVTNVDEVLVGLYRRKGEIHQRQYIANKLYRMGMASLIASVPKKKGVYRSKR